jgi:ribose transport system ATP-binding protein
VGEVHGLVGENGSGKSTVVKLLSGVITPSSGTIKIAGKTERLTSPAHAHRLGIVTVFQETLVADECTTVENVFLGSDGLFRRAHSRAHELRVAAEIGERLGLAPSALTTPPARLSLAARQTLTIARAVARDWKLLVLDEATSALDLATRNRLFDLIAEYTDAGRSVLFVSHRMDELQLLIDRATVQRSGNTVGTLDRQQATTQRLLEMMIGERELPIAAPTSSPARDDAPAQDRHAEVVVRCNQIALGHKTAAFDLSIKRGEILGLAGLDGSGAGALLEALAGLRAPRHGTIEITRGGERRSVRRYRDAYRSGIAYVPAKRQEEGLFPSLNVWDNLAIATLARHARFGLFRKKPIDRSVEEQLARLGVVPRDPSTLISGLSGGNAQKVLIGRWLASNPWLLLLNDPLRGVDLGTKLDFYRQLNAFARQGMSVVLLSTEIEELLTVCDRVAVCKDHSVRAVLGGETLTYEAILAEMFGESATPEIQQQTPETEDIRP